MSAALRYIFVVLVFSAITLPLLPFQIFASRLEHFWFKSLPLFWHKCMCRLFGFHIKTHGEIAAHRPLLLVSNHVSWSDILVLGSQAELSFIAKDEVATWPLFGTFARLQRTVFIDRNTRRKVGQQSQAIAERLKSGDILVLFAEGTTSDGNRVLPFKSSLFGGAKMALSADNPDSCVYVQPVSIAYTRRHGIPLGRYHRYIAAWPGNVNLVQHLKGIIVARSIGVEITYGAPFTYDHKTNRKQLAQRVELAVRGMNERARHNRPKAETQTETPVQIASNIEAKPLDTQS